MTIPEQYDEVVRPALARFCGWRLATISGAEYWIAPGEETYGGRTIPDPLRDPADAWRLFVAILRAEPYNSRILWYSDDHDRYHSLALRDPDDFDEASDALVAYAWEFVQGMEKGAEE